VVEVTTRKTYRATAERDGDWWFIQVPDLGRATQVRRLDQADAMVRDLVALIEGVPEDSFDVELIPAVAAEIQEALLRAQAAKGRAAVAQAEASSAQRHVARQLTGIGLTNRDVGRLLEISHQRVAQLLATPIDEPETATLRAVLGSGNRLVDMYERGRHYRTTARAIESRPMMLAKKAAARPRAKA